MKLLKVAPNAFRLAYIIASRARYSQASEDDFDLDGLTIGEALLGDFKEYGMSEMQYRLAKQKLTEWHFATFRVTPKGTIGRLIDTRLFALLPPESNTRHNTRVTPGQHPRNTRVTTNKKVRREQGNKEKILKKKIAPCADAPRCEGSLFKAPTLKEAETYAESLCLPVDVTDEWWHKQANQGWTVEQKFSGERQAMRDWQAALRAYCATVEPVEADALPRQ